MQLSQKQNTFSETFFEFLKFTLNFERFQKRDDRHSWYISKFKDYKKHG